MKLGFQVCVNIMKFSFLERPQFTKKVIKILEESDYFDLQNFLLEYPDWGDVIPKLRYPIRKARWKIKGKGKRGGARVVYYLAKSDDYIIFLDIWTKNEKKDLSRDEYRVLCDFLAELEL